eukprot:TRINITY_DN4290_c0_g2_i2.p1 TRINITY_DN4290_c0_g2~~TRINITY_DN4290_c0_g2_i2.p1  ORF type:complete len:417 (-),score=91.15 TRINITY_DN4290_c0_g2_i2:82-1332(-)
MSDVEDKSEFEMSSDDVIDKKEKHDLTGDGGLFKEITKEGTGYEKPEKGSEVSVHYVGKLEDGSVFDSSRDRGRPFEFKLGEGKVIKGWDEGVKTMKKGEIATFTIAPNYGYGATGYPPKIPPNATLTFEIELLSFKNERDISPDHDGSILKNTIEEGKDWQTPNYETKCRVHLTGKLDNGTVIVDREEEIIIGDEMVVPGLEKAIESMKQGERATFKIAPKHAYGSEGNSLLGVPPNSTLNYEVHLKEFQKEKDSWEMDGFDEKYEAASKRKEQGNELFKNQLYQRAIAKYDKAIDLMAYEHNLKDDEKKKAQDLKIPCQNNLAMVYLKLKNYKKVIETCQKVLETEPNNVKALYRRGVAYSESGDWNQANDDFTKALEIDKDNVDVKREFLKLKNKMKLQDQKDRMTYQKMFRS